MALLTFFRNNRLLHPNALDIVGHNLKFLHGGYSQTCRSSTSSMTKELRQAPGHRPEIVRLTPRKLKSSAILAANFLKSGHIVALPTDTIYGIAAPVQDKSPVQKIYSIKGRDPAKPIAICVSEIEEIYTWGHVTVPNELLCRLLPGPVTLCFERSEHLNVEFNPGTKLVGIRIPDHKFIREVCRNIQPLALTSANISAAKSTLEVAEFETLFPQLAAVFDGGRLGDTPEARLGSTVVDLSTPGFYKIIREGCAKQNTINILKEFNLKEIL